MKEMLLLSICRGTCARCKEEFELKDMGALPEVELFERHFLEYIGKAEVNPYTFTEAELMAKYGYNSLTTFCKPCLAEIIANAKS